MSYIKQQWANNDPTTPINAVRLSHIEDGLAAIDAALSILASSIGSSSGIPSIIDGGIASSTFLGTTNIDGGSAAA